MRRRLFAALLTVLLASVVTPTGAVAQGLALDTVEVASGLVRPLIVAAAGDGSGRLFIGQQTGEILVRDGTGVLATPFLDLSGLVVCCNERGLLGLAFHPGYAANGELFVSYTREQAGQLQSVLARYRVSDADPDQADPASAEILLVRDQPAANHNGGHLAFGPDGFLYLALGDGGPAGDPGENGQALDTLLGKILRLDVDAADTGLAYAIPASNPFTGDPAARGEIWAYGLRNPWRFSFDRATGDLFIGDVGQAFWEEVDFQPAASPGGENYGWDCREGAHNYADTNGDRNATCTGSGYTEPILEYFQENGLCSVTGGYRYRGAAEPRLQGVYLYADFCTGKIFGTVPRCDGAWQSRELLDAPFLVSTFGEDESGELYVSEHTTSGNPTGRIHRLVLAAGSGGPDLASAPDPVDFGQVEAGDTVETIVTFGNDNLGPEAAFVSAITLAAGAELTLDRRGGPQRCRDRPCLSPGAACTVVVRLHATSAGTLSGTLTATGNAAPAEIPVTAEVVPCSSAQNLTLTGATVTGTETHRACDTLTAGPAYTVDPGGDLTLRAGTRIVLGSGFRVAAGGRLRTAIF